MNKYLLEEKFDLKECGCLEGWWCEECEEFYPMSIYKRGVKVEVRVDEVLIEAFRYWLDVVNASDFGDDEGLEGVLV